VSQDSARLAWLRRDGAAAQLSRDRTPDAFSLPRLTATAVGWAQ
jgi:hypothetical protein